jgi:hypothetical protein
MTDETPKSFYKYYSVEGAIATLCNETRRWTKPSAFNDLFDCKIIPTFNMEEKNLLELFRKNYPDYHISNEEFFFHIIKREGILDFVNKDLEYQRQIAKPLHDKILEKLRIFCVSEDRDSSYLWGTYADNNRGAMIEFSNFYEVDSPLLLAKKVIYSDEEPRIEFMSKKPTLEQNRDFHEKLTLTKQTQWSNEKEWRVIDFLDKHSEYKDYLFDRREVAAIYLGCRMKDSAKKAIKLIAKEKYPHAKIFQARTHESEYSLVFDEIL